MGKKKGKMFFFFKCSRDFNYLHFFQLITTYQIKEFFIASDFCQLTATDKGKKTFSVSLIVID